MAHARELNTRTVREEEERRAHAQTVSDMQKREGHLREGNIRAHRTVLSYQRRHKSLVAILEHLAPVSPLAGLAAANEMIYAKVAAESEVPLVIIQE